MRKWVLLAVLFLPLPGCCGVFAGPPAARVNEWAEKELPLGAPASVIEAFRTRHGFQLDERGHPIEPLEIRLLKTRDTCLATSSYVVVDIMLDEQRRIRKVIINNEFQGFC